MAAVHPGAIAVLAGALGYAISHVLTKRLSATQTPLVILFYMTAIQLPLGLVLALPGWVWPSTASWPWVAVVALTALSAHYCLARALHLADATVVVPLDYLRLPLIAVVGFIFYGEALDPWLLVGATIVFAATWLNLKSARGGSAARSSSS
jgi:drug/metabolite transporter (DMT)-like permease